MVREIYKQNARPMARVVRGLPISWEPVVATIYHEDLSGVAAWSPCNKFVAVARSGAVEIRDAVTLNLPNTFKALSYPTDNARLLCFSPDGFLLTQLNNWDFVTWDLQTGGSVGTTFPKGLHPDYSVSPAYSMDGKMLAGVYRGSDCCIVTHDLSTTHAHVYSIPKGCTISQIWTHGEFLRSLTVESEYVTIWEADFTFTHPPKAVGSFPHLSHSTAETFPRSLFLPSLSRLAIILEDTVLVLDLPDSKSLLKITLGSCSGISFSSDGRFFACVGGGEVHVFKESSAGYILHQQLAFVNRFPKPLLSPNGESIIVPLDSTIHLWHTKDPILSNGPTQVISQLDFTLQFFQNEPSAAFARLREDTVTILDLQSGDPQLVIDTGVKVESLGVTESTVVVVDGRKIVAWNLAVGNTRASINDSLQITALDLPPPPWVGPPFDYISVSPDLSRILTLLRRGNLRPMLQIFDVSTGRYLAGTYTSSSTLGPYFSPDGCEIWGTDSRLTLKGWRIVEDNEFSTTKLQLLDNTTPPPGILPWQSSHGYKVTRDGWILGPTKRRLLWLPHRWRSGSKLRTWSGRFLGLTHRQLPDVVILEFFD